MAAQTRIDKAIERIGNDSRFMLIAEALKAGTVGFASGGELADQLERLAWIIDGKAKP
jgi:hypothetical protein